MSAAVHLSALTHMTASGNAARVDASCEAWEREGCRSALAEGLHQRRSATPEPMMSALKLRSDHDKAVELLLEPSGHHFEMPPGSMFEVVPRFGAQLEIHHSDPDLMVVGDVAKVIHNGEVLASWESAGEPSTPAPTGPHRIGSVEELRAFLQTCGEQVFAKPDGALIFRHVNRKAWAVRVQWRDDQDLVHVEAATSIGAPAEREPQLALAISRIYASNAIPGFQIVRGPGPELGVTYWVVLMMDDRRSIATTVLRRAIEVCFDMVMRYSDRLEAVASGEPDPGVP